MKKLSLVLVVIFIASCLGCVPMGMAFATENDVYSFVMDDLRKDETFDEMVYLPVDGDYSLHVIQVAEGEGGELFVYVYQPFGSSRNLLASSITLARSKSGKDSAQNLSFVNYKLTYLNSSEVFFKYKITNFSLSSDTVRHYNVAAIMRPWDSTIDEPAPNGNKITEVPFEVNKLWTVTAEGDNVSYAMQETETVRITSKIVGYVNYSDGWRLWFGGTTSGATSAHFVAFSTDRQIDKLVEVEVSFKTQDAQYRWCDNFIHAWHYKQKFDYIKSDPIDHDNVVLRETDKAATNVGVSFADKHEWNRIMTSQEFLDYHDSENGDYQLVTDDKANIQKQQWVLSFYETPIYQEGDVGWSLILGAPIDLLWKGEKLMKYTEVYELVMLRMMFQKDGETYNLGVIDNKQTGSGKPSNISNSIQDLKDALAKIEGFFNKAKLVFEFLLENWWLLIVGVLAIGLIVSLIVSIVKLGAKVVFKAVGKILWWILKIVFYIVSLPVWLIIWGAKAFKKSKR